MGNDLLISINADAANVKKAFDDIREQTEDLEKVLEKVALVSAVAFAAFTAEIVESSKAFEEARAQSVQLTNALQNQGIFTEQLKSQYEGYSAAVQAATGIDSDALSKAQAIAQAHLGQTKVTQELTFAIADLAQTMGGDLNGAAEKIGLTIGSTVNTFRRQGLQMDASASQAERYSKVLEFVQTKAGGLAAAMNEADGYSKALATSFQHFQEAIGANFAPIIEQARIGMIAFFNAFTEHPVLADLAVSAIAAGAAVTGIVAVIAAGVPIFLALSAAVTALGVSLSIAFVGIPLLIGAVIAGVTLLALNWDKVMNSIAAISSAVVTNLSELFGGLGKVLLGAFTLDPTKITEGLSQLHDAFAKTRDDAQATYASITASQVKEGEAQDANKKALADKEEALAKAHQANLAAIRKSEIDLINLQNAFASAELIKLKTEEIATLKALGNQNNTAEISQLQQKLKIIQGLESQQQKEDQERAVAFAKLQADTKATLQSQGVTTEATIRQDRLAAIQATADTEADIDRQLQDKLLSQKIAQRNAEMLDRKKYGVTVATINKALASDEVTGATSAANDLVALQQSKNETLKTIGKIAAVEQITVSTAQAAMNIYAGFSTIPIVGPALGIIGAAAAVAFGAERIATVVAANDGGLIEGGIPGLDSVPALLTPGELVVPQKNFNDVVGAVQNQGQGQSTDPEVVALLTSIDKKFSNPQITQINGDVTTDTSYIDSLVRQISDAIEFRNAKIFGVNI